MTTPYASTVIALRGLHLDDFVAAAWSKRFVDRFGESAENVAQAAVTFSGVGHTPAVTSLQLAEGVAAGPAGAQAADGIARLAHEVRAATGADMHDAARDAMRFGEALGGPRIALELANTAKSHARVLRTGTASEVEQREFWGAAMTSASRLAGIHGGEGAAQVVTAALKYTKLDTARDLVRSADEISDVVRGASGTVLGRMHDEMAMPWDVAWRLSAKVEATSDVDVLLSVARRLTKEFDISSEAALASAEPLARGEVAPREVMAAFDELCARFPEEKSIGLFWAARGSVEKGVSVSAVTELAEHMAWLAGGTSTSTPQDALSLITRLGEAGARQTVDLALRMRHDMAPQVAMERADRLVSRVGPERARRIADEQLPLPTDGGRVRSAALAWTDPASWARDAKLSARIVGTSADVLAETHHRVLTGMSRHLTVTASQRTLDRLRTIEQDIRVARSYLRGGWNNLLALGLDDRPLHGALKRIDGMDSMVKGWIAAVESAGYGDKVKLRQFRGDFVDLRLETGGQIYWSEDSLRRFMGDAATRGGTR